MAFAWICKHEDEETGKVCKGRSRKTYKTKEAAIASALLHKHPLTDIEIMAVHGNLKCVNLRDKVQSVAL